MNGHRRPPLRSANYQNINKIDINPNVITMEQAMKEVSFLRINLDKIVFAEGNSMIEDLIKEGRLFGFSLDYQFPCPNGVSSALSPRVRVPAKSFSTTEIQFKHKRVVLIKFTPEALIAWQRGELIFSISILIEFNGKYTSRSLANCRVALSDLVVPPFMISNDFFFHGQHFEGYGMVRIDLGTKNKTLMEKIEEMRGVETPILDNGRGSIPIQQPSVPYRARSRSTSRCHSRSARSPSPPILPTIPPEQRNVRLNSNRTNSVASLPQSLHTQSSGSDDVFDVNMDNANIQYHNPPPIRREPEPVHHRVREFDITSGRDVVEVASGPARKRVVKLTVHCAADLPPIFDERGNAKPPNTFLSVRGRDGELRSLTSQGCRPRWEWTAQFAISSERQNLVVKVIHTDGIHAEKPIGFVAIPQPIRPTIQCDYEMVDLSGRMLSKVPTLKLSIELVTDRVPSVIELGSERATSSRQSRRSQVITVSIFGSRNGSLNGTFVTDIRRSPTPEILESREEIDRKLKRHLSDLEQMVRNLS